jgi:hypothetical protein
MKPVDQRVLTTPKDFGKVIKDRATDRWITPTWAAKKGRRQP